MKKTKFEILHYVSGVFLCDFIPEDWETLTEDEQNAFVEENTVKWLEFTPAKDIWELITDEANRLTEFINDNRYYGVVKEIDNNCECLSKEDLPDIASCKEWIVKNKPTTTGTLFFSKYRRDKNGLVQAICDYDLAGNLEFSYDLDVLD